MVSAIYQYTMAFQSIWYFSDIPEKIVETIEEDLTDNFQQQMGDSRLMGDALNRDKRQQIGLQDLFGIMLKEQIVKIFFMT
jgi:hypothetical protein